MAAALHLPLELATAGIIALPWNHALWLGAVAFDGTVYLDPARLLDATLTREELDAAIESGLRDAADDEERYRDGRAFPSLRGRPAILVDDGLSPSCVVRVVMSALENAGASRVVLALPTGKQYEVKRLAERAFRTYCANLHHDLGAQLARAYQDVDQPASLSPDKP
jgi:putative phosphoribosyl transferase